MLAVCEKAEENKLEHYMLVRCLCPSRQHTEERELEDFDENETSATLLARAKLAVHAHSRVLLKDCNIYTISVSPTDDSLIAYVSPPNLLTFPLTRTFLFCFNSSFVSIQ